MSKLIHVTQPGPVLGCFLTSSGGTQSSACGSKRCWQVLWFQFPCCSSVSICLWASAGDAVAQLLSYVLCFRGRCCCGGDFSLSRSTACMAAAISRCCGTARLSLLLKKHKHSFLQLHKRFGALWLKIKLKKKKISPAISLVCAAPLDLRGAPDLLNTPGAALTSTWH